MIIVDRIENDIAICELESEFINIPVSNIKGELREGAILIKIGDSYTIDENLTDARKKSVFEKQKKLFNI